MCCSHLLRSTCPPSGGIQGEVRRCHEGTQQCGKRKSGEIRSLEIKETEEEVESKVDPGPPRSENRG